MIAARGGDGEKDFVLMILEPANLAKLQLGQPIVKSLNEFIPELTTKIDLLLAWCPDVGYLEERVKSGIGLVDALKDAMTRAEVFNRPYRDPEALEKVKGITYLTPLR